METLTTNGIKITVTTSYQSKFSKPLENRFVFAYTVDIENNNDFTVQLLRRHWHILDSNGILREVEGDGVIGKQPVLSPGESHQYISWSQLLTDLGKMYGTFLMIRLTDQEAFRVRIPEFKLVAPFKLN